MFSGLIVNIGQDHCQEKLIFDWISRLVLVWWRFFRVLLIRFLFFFVFACYQSWWMILPRYVKLSLLSNTCSSVVISTGLLALMGMTLVLLLFISSPICCPKCWSLFVFSWRCVCVCDRRRGHPIVKVFNDRIEGPSYPSCLVFCVFSHNPFYGKVEQ